VCSSDLGNDTTGTSWGTAKKTVTAGISTASSGKEIWVAATKYIESATIQLKSGTALYGGFVGSSENVREQRDWITNKTILDGNDTKRVVSGASGTTAENCIIDGFIIQNGRASTGAGLYFSSNAATVSHNIIRLNNSLKTSSGKGAGIYCSNASPMIANNWIVGNEVIAYSGTDPGGAIYLNNSNATIVNNTIAHNSAVRAGAIYITGSSYSPTITNNIIALNSSGIYMSSGTPSITYNDVWGNSNDESDPLYWKLGNPETNHNISADPLMVYSSLGDLRIKLDSPCKDTGLDTVTLPDSLDINRNNRRNGLIDMGANEWTTADPIPTPL
jgi:hypothetical protein